MKRDSGNAEFGVKIMEKLQETNGNIQVQYDEILGNNGVKRPALVLKGSDRQGQLTIHLEEYGGRYRAGEDIGTLAGEIAALYAACRLNEGMRGKDKDTFKDKARIIYRLVGCKQNQALLAGRVHKELFGNLAAVFGLALDFGSMGHVEVGIEKEDLVRWGIDEQELWELAQRNTPRLRPAVMRPMAEMMRDMIRFWGEKALEESLGDTVSEESTAEEAAWRAAVQEVSMLKEAILEAVIPAVPGKSGYFLSNTDKTNGAAALAYPGILEAAAEHLGGDLVILPSSIHEVILVKWEEYFNLKEMAETVWLINRDAVRPYEVLADSAYLYRRETKEIERADADGAA